MRDLTILIPARNEMFLRRTVEDILEHKEGNTEVLIGCDGTWPEPGIVDHKDVNMLHYSESIGQRAITNKLALLAQSKYLMKVDAHCAFDQGFDVKLMADMDDNWTVVPAMRNLHAFNWVCKKCGDTRYQGPTPVSCPKCDNTTDFERDVVWIPKTNPLSTSYCFDSEPHFQYFRDFQKRPEGIGDLTETMSLQGSCFMLTRDKYFELNVSDEEFGSWGSQGIEVAVKTWLSGGRVLVNHKTWYAHMFRTQGGDFGFPYSISGRQVEHAKKTARNLFFENRWEKQIRPLSWLIEKFWPIPGWSEKQLNDLKSKQFKGILPEKVEVKNVEIEEVKKSTTSTKAVLYYCDSEKDISIVQPFMDQLKRAAGDLEIVSVTLKPLDFGRNIVLPLKRSYLTMAKQILAGLEALNTDYVFFAEDDVLYHPSHFQFTPPTRNVYYYNQNCWQVRREDGFAVYYDAKRLSQICADREFLITHYKKRISLIEAAGGDAVKIGHGLALRMGFEPGSHHRPERVDDFKSDVWRSEFPNLDVASGHTLTNRKWKPEDFRDQRNCKNWKQADSIEGWGQTKDRFEEFLKELGSKV